MADIIIGYIFAILYGGVCLAMGLIAYKLGLPKKYSRKVVHIAVGFEWVILYRYMGASIHFLAVCLAFTALLLISHMKKLLPMISSDSENAPGTVYYGVAMSVMALISLFVPDMLIPFGIGVFCTSLGDGFAGVIGQLIKKFNPRLYGKKTLFGMLANFVFSFAAAYVFSLIFELKISLLYCIAIAILSVGLETVTGYGLDNITTTLGVSFFTYGVLYFDKIGLFVIPILVTPALIAVVLSRRVLTPLGLAFAIFLDAVVSLTLGNFGFILLLSFLILSVVTDKIKKLKNESDGITKRASSCRDHIQVLANGLIPMVMAILYSATLERAFIAGYIAALCEAFADTAASGIGAFSSKTFDPFKMRECKRGLSGGMSLIGTLASLVGAALMGGIACALGMADFKFFIIAVLAAFLGAVFDSFLGSVFQIKYKCTACGELTEREEHCEVPTVRASGFEFFDNDVVNLLSGAFSAALATLLAIVI